jgi:hypothetical protein
LAGRELQILLEVAMVGLLLLMMFASAGFAPLHVYDGTWTVSSAHTMAGEGKPDTLVNHCTESGSFYVCEQVINGRSMSLVVFTAASEAGKYYSDVVLADGRTVGRTDLTVTPDHWTYLSSGVDQSGKRTYFRTENYFKGQDSIHFELYQSGDDKVWVMTGRGDEVREK